MKILNSIIRPLTYNIPSRINTLSELDIHLYKYFTNNNFTNNYSSLNEINNILSRYNGDDWKEYKLYDKNADYLKHEYNKCYIHQLYAIIIISWNKDRYIKIHNHADNGCSFKILEGSLKETIYNKNLIKIRTNHLQKNDISSIHNDIGYHSITTTNNKAYSLHVYSPYNYSTNFLE
jgi:hypothetical protein